MIQDISAYQELVPNASSDVINAATQFSVMDARMDSYSKAYYVFKDVLMENIYLMVYVNHVTQLAKRVRMQMIVNSAQLDHFYNSPYVYKIVKPIIMEIW